MSKANENKTRTVGLTVDMMEKASKDAIEAGKKQEQKESQKDVTPKK